MESAAKNENPDLSPDDLRQLQKHQQAFEKLAFQANAIHQLEAAEKNFLLQERME